MTTAYAIFTNADDPTTNLVSCCCRSLFKFHHVIFSSSENKPSFVSKNLHLQKNILWWKLCFSLFQFANQSKSVNEETRQRMFAMMKIVLSFIFFLSLSPLFAFLIWKFCEECKWTFVENSMHEKETNYLLRFTSNFVLDEKWNFKESQIQPSDKLKSNMQKRNEGQNDKIERNKANIGLKSEATRTIGDQKWKRRII